MKLTAVYARFFRSLNFDFMKRSSPGYIPLPWDDVPGGLAPYPFVKVTLDPHITTVVGANESGKSQVLAAIEFGLTGDKVLQRDFCRYSPFFLRHKDLLLPEFGLRFNDLSVTDLPLLGEVIGQKVEVLPDELAYFRMNTTPKTRIYLRHGEQWTIATVKKPTALEQLGMPSVFKIDAGFPFRTPCRSSTSHLDNQGMRCHTPRFVPGWNCYSASWACCPRPQTSRRTGRP
nr:hypothetical protein GCM10025699_35740 [Microbacterium flavescens]